MHESHTERDSVCPVPRRHDRLPFRGAAEAIGERATRQSCSPCRYRCSVFLFEANATSNYMSISVSFAAGNLITVTALPQQE